jgi:hypothetical protein
MNMLREALSAMCLTQHAIDIGRDLIRARNLISLGCSEKEEVELRRMAIHRFRHRGPASDMPVTDIPNIWAREYMAKNCPQDAILLHNVVASH